MKYLYYKKDRERKKRLCPFVIVRLSTEGYVPY